MPKRIIPEAVKRCFLQFEFRLGPNEGEQAQSSPFHPCGDLEEILERRGRRVLRKQDQSCVRRALKSGICFAHL